MYVFLKQPISNWKYIHFQEIYERRGSIQKRLKNRPFYATRSEVAGMINARLKLIVRKFYLKLIAHYLFLEPID